MSQVLDVQALLRLLVLARVELAAQESVLNAMNVFPIPDGDTGTNMRATMDAGLQASAHMSEHDQASVQHVMRAIARAARGNSGVILAEYIQGFLSEARPIPDGGFGLDARALARALNEAARRARKAVSDPVEGTVITIADAAAVGAAGGWREYRGLRERAGEESAQVTQTEKGQAGGRHGDAQGHPGNESGSLAQVALGALDAASRALEHSPQQLAALRSAGVVDAGGAGLVILLDALARMCVGGVLPATSGRSLVRRLATSPLRNADACQVLADGPDYEVMAVSEGLSPEQADALRATLGDVGESVVVAGSQGLYRLHVHTNAVVAAVSAMRACGLVSEISVVKFTAPAQCDAAITTPDPALRAYARALGIHAEKGEAAAFLNGDCVSRTGVELIDFLDEIEFAASVAGEDAELSAPESSWLVASYETAASAYETLISLQDDITHERTIMVLSGPNLAERDRHVMSSLAREHPEISLLHVDSGHPVQIGISHE